MEQQERLVIDRLLATAGWCVCNLAFREPSRESGCGFSDRRPASADFFKEI